MLRIVQYALTIIILVIVIILGFFINNTYFYSGTCTWSLEGCETCDINSFRAYNSFTGLCDCDDGYWNEENN